MSLNSAKNKIIKIEETLPEVKFIQISYKLLLIWPDIEHARYRGSVLEGKMSWNLKMCPL